MTNSIKWLRLKKICSELLDNKYAVQLHGSTMLSDEIRAAVTVKDNTVDIAINLSYVKSLDEVIAALSHEVTHILLQSDDDNHSEFNKVWKNTEKEVIKKYNNKK